MSEILTKQRSAIVRLPWYNSLRTCAVNRDMFNRVPSEPRSRPLVAQERGPLGTRLNE